MSIWSIRELRIVSYYLMKLQGNEGAYRYALNLLDSNWRDLFSMDCHSIALTHGT